MIPRDHFPRRTRLAVIEEDEVLDKVEQLVVREHAVEQHLRFQAALVSLIQALPLPKVIPLAGNRPVAGAMSVADNEERVVVKGVGDDVLIKVVPQVAVEARANVPVHGFQLNEHEGQAVDETDQIGAAIVARRAQPRNLQLTYRKEAVVRPDMPRAIAR